MPRLWKFKVAVLRGDLTKQAADAIVNPASSLMWMGGGAAGAIRRAGGAGVEREALEHAPLPVGEAVATGAGKLGARWVVHAPTMEHPTMPTTAEKVFKATLAALACADRLGARSVVIPGMGTGVGKVTPDKAADAMIRAIGEFSCEAKAIETIILCVIDEAMVAAWRQALGN